MTRLLFTLALSGLLLIAGGARAQSTGHIVYAYKYGDLWRFNLADGSETQLTDWGYTSGPILAPDGNRLAYLSTSPEFIAQFNAGSAGQTAGSPPANIWIMDIASESAALVADQTGASAAGYLRSLPAWSADGRRLAWLELDPGAQALDSAKLLIHDTATGAASVLADNVDLGYQNGNIRLPDLSWGRGGIARLRFFYPPDSANPALFIEFYDAASGDLTQYDLELNPSRDNDVRDLVWVDHLGNSLVALQIQDYWEIINPYDGTRLRLTDPPRLKNRSIAGAMQLIPASVANASGDWDIHWYATTGANLQYSSYVSPRVNQNYLPAMSPVGTEMAWHAGDGVDHWQISMAEANRALASDVGHGREFPIPEPVSVVWAPTEWVTTGSVAGAPVLLSSSVNCGLLPLLNANQNAIVGPDLTLRVRHQAMTSGSLLGNLEGGAVVAINDGPVCADGYNWYSVSNDDISGWTAEGADGDYWLLYHVACSDSPATRLTTNMTATVSGERTVNIRDGAGTENTQIVWAVAAGDEFAITGLPQCGAAGLRWYPVRIDEKLGWIAEGQGEHYWIEPVET